MKKLSLYVLAIVCLAVAPGAAFAVDVQKVVSDKGIEAWLIQDTSNPITTVKFSFKGGSVLDPAEKAGLANLAASTMDEGAGDMDSQSFQQALNDKTISLGFEAARDSFRGSLRTLNATRDDAFEYLRLAMTEPRFDAEPVERLRARLISDVRQRRSNPGAMAFRRIWESAYPGHPYAQPRRGTEEGLTAITPDDLRGFVRNRLARNNLTVGVVGDITPEDLKKYLDDVFGALPETAAPSSVPDVTPNLDGGVKIVDVDVVQSAIRFVQPGIKREDPDFYTAYVLNYILGGGGFVSRLYSEVREKRGLVYSVYSFLMPLDHTSLVGGSAGTANERVAETLETVRSVWKTFAEEGPTAEELTDAKTYLTGSYPLRFTSSSAIADMLVGMQEDNLGIDYFDKRNSLIEAVTLDDAKRVAKSLYQPEKLTFVIAGRPVGVIAN